jgi:FkbM family methyltransferase
LVIARRIIGALSRRLDRPELLAAVDRSAARDLRDSHAMASLLVATLREDSVYVDVGTNRGQLLAGAVRVAPRGRHIAFEPIPALAADVARRFPSVRCRAVAVSAAPGTASFCHFRALDGWSGLRRRPSITDEQGAPEFFDVEVVTLDAELEGLRPRLIKIDVEGAERDVLAGAATVLRHARPMLIIEHEASAAALFGATSGEIWDLLSGLDYRLFAASGVDPVARGDFGRSGETMNWVATPVT